MQIKLLLNKQQRGNTLLGLIIGALVGLGAALAVAVYVTKVPILFLNKNQPRSAEIDAAEVKKNRDWDPNGPLASKNSVKPAPAAPGLEGVDAPAPPSAAASATVFGKARMSADPLGDLAKTRSEAKPDARPETVPAAGGVDPFSYFIQVGAFRTPEDAEQQRAKLSLLGFQVKVTEREQSGRTVYRVRLGPFDKKDEADKTKEKLDSQSIETALVRVQR
jgi:cell division protein FtsN